LPRARWYPRSKSAIGYTFGPAKPGTRPAGSPSASTSRAATSSASTGWNRIADGTGSIGILCASCRPRYGHSMSRIVEDNPGERRFELRVDGELVGWSDYRPAGDSVIVAHTGIDERREGEGLGSVLVRATLDHIRASGKTVIPSCTFTAAYIRRHPEYVELVDARLRGQFASSA
jgi:uncharacterized protein